MSSRTRIVVLHMKEVVYTAIFLLFAIIMITLLFLMFGPKSKEEAASTAASYTDSPQYIAGVYSSSIELNDNTFDVQVTVDSNHINAIELVNLSETTTAMYPLIEPALDKLAEQIYLTQSTQDIAYEPDCKYTSMLLLEAIKSALTKASMPS